MNPKSATAAFLLGAALSDLIPQGYILECGERGNLFYVDIVMGESLHRAFLAHLERRMRELISKNMAIKVHEMIPSNAAEFLKSKKRFYPALRLNNHPQPLVKVAAIDSFIDLVEGDLLETTGACTFDRLTSIEERLPLFFRKVKKEVYRIQGRLNELPILDPYLLGEEIGLFEVNRARNEHFLEDQKICFKGSGEALHYRLYQKWREIHLSEGYELTVGGLLDRAPSATFSFENGQVHDYASWPCSREEETDRIERSEKIIERLKLHPKAPYQIETKKMRGGLQVIHSVFLSIEKMVLQVLEDPEKDLSQKKELLGIV